MGGKTSNASKSKYNEKAYDRLSLYVPKGTRDIIKTHAEAQGESVNGFVSRAITEQMKRDGQEK